MWELKIALSANALKKKGKQISIVIKIITYVLISKLRNYDLQTDVFLLINLSYCASIVLLLQQDKYRLDAVAHCKK